MPDVGNTRARYRRILRFAARYIVQAWWYELVLPRIGLAKVSARGRAARLEHIAQRFHVLAVDLGGLMIKVGQFMSSRLDVLPPEITKELEGLQDEVPAGAVRGDPTRSPRPSSACRSSARTRRSTRHRWPRHPSVRRTARGSRRRRRRHGTRRRRRQGAAARASTRSSTSTCGAAPRRRLAQPRAGRRRPRRPARARRGVRARRATRRSTTCRRRATPSGSPRTSPATRGSTLRRSCGSARRAAC